MTQNNGTLASTDLVTMGWVCIHPDYAQSILEGTPPNYRRMSLRRLQEYARDIAAGQWMPTGEAIKFDAEGHLLDGQHRLAACVLAGRSFTTLVIRNLPPAAVEQMDRGMSRTYAQVLTHRGISGATKVSTAAAVSLRWNDDGRRATFDHTYRPTNSELNQWLEANRGIEGHTKSGDMLHRYFRISPGVATAFSYRAAIHNPLFATPFLQELIEGGEKENCALALFRRWARVALQERVGNKTPAPPQSVQTALLIKAFNYWVQKRPLQLLRWSPREIFPVMERTGE